MTGRLEDVPPRRDATKMKLLPLVLLAAALGAALAAPPLAGQVPDLVLANGRVIDPASGTDAIGHVGIVDGRIAVISAQPIDGRRIVDVSGLVVAPGFIDLHAHGQNRFSSRLQALDGVTTALEFEFGVFPVASWYAAREGKAYINYGASVGHIAARISVMHGIAASDGEVADPTGETAASGGAPARPARWADDVMTAAELGLLQQRLQQGLDEGALGIGFGLAYTPAAGREEIWRAFEIAARNDVLTHVHLRSSGGIEPRSTLGALQEVLANAASTGAALHVAHIATTARRQLPVVLEIIDRAREQGVDVSTEVYPWEAAQTGLASAIFDEGWQQRTGATYGDLEWAATGERLTEETFKRYRAQQPPGSVIAHIIPAEIVELGLTHPGVMVVSDGPAYVIGRGHPRGAGSFARTLGQYVRERKVLGLADALAKMTILPARRLEAAVPQMARKGRLQPGADADITVFDPRTVGERATYRNPVEPSTGIVHVLVGGTFIVRDSTFVPDVFPGQAVRRTPQEQP
jgi:N-acyl-D-aspartate/D-glutamate deacylase